MSITVYFGLCSQHVLLERTRTLTAIQNDVNHVLQTVGVMTLQPFVSVLLATIEPVPRVLMWTVQVCHGCIAKVLTAMCSKEEKCTSTANFSCNRKSHFLYGMIFPYRITDQMIPYRITDQMIPYGKRDF